LKEIIKYHTPKEGQDPAQFAYTVATDTLRMYYNIVNNTLTPENDIYGLLTLTDGYDKPVVKLLSDAYKKTGIIPE